MSSDEKVWADGYLSEIGYTFDYHRRTNPLHMRLAFLNAGLQPPDVATACDVGCGQGVSLAMHAAAGAAHWFGTDINQEHVDYARKLAQASGSEIAVFNDSFVDFADRRDLPDFDFMAVHGVWSWISDKNRAAIIRLLQRRLKPGGVAYISYNTYPGWSVFEPIRHLMVEHAKSPGSRERDIVDRIDRALEFVNAIVAAEPAYARDTPLVASQLKELQDSNRRYLAHEYFNKDWRPVHFSDMAPLLADAGLTYACSGEYADAIEILNIEPKQRALLATIDDPILHQTTRDFVLNRRFRHDYWIKGSGTKLADRAEALRAERIVLVSERPEIPLKIRALLTLNGDRRPVIVMPAMLEQLSDYKPHSLGQIETALADTATLEQIFRLAILFFNFSTCAAAQRPVEIEEGLGTSSQLNAHLVAEAAKGSEVRHLASPVLGGAIEVGLIEQLFLLARVDGNTTPERWAQEAHRLLGLRPESPQAVQRKAKAHERELPALIERARKFAEVRLPLLQALQVV